MEMVITATISETEEIIGNMILAAITIPGGPYSGLRVMRLSVVSAGCVTSSREQNCYFLIQKFLWITYFMASRISKMLLSGAQLDCPIPVDGPTL